MKTENNRPPYNRAELHAHIETSHEIFKREELVQAHSLAECNAGNEEVQTHIRGIQARYLALLAKVKTIIQGATEKAHGQLDQESAEMEMGKNNEALNRSKEEKRIDEADRRKLHIAYDWSLYRWRVFLEVLIFGAEVSFNTYAFSVLGGILLLAILPAIGFAICLALAAYFIPRFIRNIPERAHRIRTGLVIAVFMFAIFLVIGILRSIAALGNGTMQSLFTSNVIAGAFIFALLNFFMFCAAMILAWGLPSKDDRRDKNEYDRLSKRIEFAKQNIDRLEGANRNIVSAANHSKRGRISAVGEEVHFEGLIKTLSAETIHLFIAEFTIKRPKRDDHYLDASN